MRFLDPPLNCNKFTAKLVSWFKPKRIVIHTCIWGKYLNGLEGHMLWSPILLSLQHYNYISLSYSHSRVYMENKVLGSFCQITGFFSNNSGVLFQLLGENCKIIIMLLHLSVYMHTSSKWRFIRIVECVSRLLSGRGNSHTQTKKHSSCKRGCQKRFL